MKLIWVINIFLIAGTFNFLASQSKIKWPLGGLGNESILDLKRSSKYFIVSGSYTYPFIWNNDTLKHFGGEDIFLAALNEEGDPVWIQYGGSSENDKLGGIAVSDNNSVALAGSFWGKLNLPAFSLETIKHPKEGFISVFSEDGEFMWAKNIRGTSSKEITSVVFLKNENLCITGYFSDTIFVDSLKLVSHGLLDGFFVCFESSGNTLRIEKLGGTGNIFPQKILAGDSNSIFITGNFDGSILLSEDSIFSNTGDDDIFVAKFNSKADLEWLKKGGGVHTDNVLTADISESGVLIIGGTFVGTLQMDNMISLSSDEGFGDGFLIGISNKGIPSWGKKFGGTNFQSVRSISNNYASGLFFRKLTTEDGFDFSTAQETPQFFNIKINPINGELEKINVFENQGNYFPNTSLLWGDKFLSGGSFSQKYLDIFSMGGFDGLIWETDLSVRRNEIRYNNFEINIFPNPVNEKLFWTSEIEIDRISIFDSEGKIHSMSMSSNEIEVSHLKEGIYYILFETIDGLFKALKFVKF